VQGYYFGRPTAEPDFRGTGRALRLAASAA